MPDHGSMRGSDIEGRYQQADINRQSRIAASERQHANYSDPPKTRRWWQFWRRTEDRGDTRP